jgi:hypothetical protein
MVLLIDVHEKGYFAFPCASFSGRCETVRWMVVGDWASVSFDLKRPTTARAPREGGSPSLYLSLPLQVDDDDRRTDCTWTSDYSCALHCFCPYMDHAILGRYTLILLNSDVLFLFSYPSKPLVPTHINSTRNIEDNELFLF